MKLPGDLSRDLALDREDVFQISIVFLCPDMRIGAGVDQLRVYVEPGAGFAHATFQYMRHAKRITDLARVVLVTILHDAGPADDLESGDFRQLGQKIVLDAVGKGRVLSVVA